MTDTDVKELTTKIDEVRQAIVRLEERLSRIEASEPGTIRTDHPLIVRVQGVCGGRPIIEGTRLSVKLIVGWVQMGMTPEAIIAQYPSLTASQVADALAYYHEHPEEIDAEFAEEKRHFDVEIPRLQQMVAERRQQTS